MCQKATEAGAKGFAIYEMTSSLSNMIFSRGGDVISADGKKATFNSAAGVESLKQVQDLVKKGYAYQVAEAYGDQTDFTAGKVLFTFGSSAGLPYYRTGIKDSKAPFEWGVAAMPHGAQVKQAVVDIYGPSICVFKTKPEKQLAAWLFLRWFTQTEQTSQWAQVANYFPMRKSALETETFKKFLAAEPNYSKALALLPQGKGEPTISAWSDIRGFMADAYTAVINGEDPQKALDAAATKADAKLAGK